MVLLLVVVVFVWLASSCQFPLPRATAVPKTALNKKVIVLLLYGAPSKALVVLNTNMNSAT